ncbi:DUF4981 domain-containing protein [Gracilibacillus sp. D59]|uniref:DUF4981 domain-containing protein n=1 Tax=Gracilibacillus sp. D59 TaxID=3457434 RepID=UPI003FCDE4B9
MKTCYRNIDFEEVNFVKGEVKIINKFLFQSLKDFKLVWTVEEEGEILESGFQLLDVEPESEQLITLPYHTSSFDSSKEQVINLQVVYKNEP